MKFCKKCLKDIDETTQEYVMFIVKSKKRIKEFYCFHVKCWKKHFERVLEEYKTSGKIW